MNEEFQAKGNLSDEQLYRLAYKRVKEKREFYTHLAVYILVNIGLWVSSGAFLTGFIMGYYPTWVTIGWGIGVACHGISVFFSMNSKAVDKEYEKLRNRHK